MQIKEININNIHPYANNAKLHPIEQIHHIANSIKRFGFRQPLVLDSDNVIVVGHGRLLAAKELGLETVPVTYADDLTEEEIKALRLADNKTNESEWDDEALDTELEDIFDIDMADFGFELESDFNETEEVIEDEVPPLPEEPKSKIGDIYQLGMHRIMCGSATDMTQVSLLLDGVEIDAVVTDPLYNMNYMGAGKTKDRKSKKIINDNMPEDEFKKFLMDMYSTYLSVMKDGASIYCFYKELGCGDFITTMKESGLTFKQELIWVKNQIVLGGSNYQSMYEPCLYGSKGKASTWNGKRRQRSVIESIDLMNEDELREAVKTMWADLNSDVVRENKNLINDLHPTMKPIRLLARFIRNSSNEGDAIADFFGGSGSTLMAAEQINRHAYLMELDPRYVDVTIERWENFTGRKAELVI